MSNLHTLPSLTVDRLEDMLDEALLERTRLNRRIKALRNVVKAAHDGAPLPDLAEIVGSIPQPRVPRSESRQPFAVPTNFTPNAASAQPQPGEGPAVANFGPGLPPGVASAAAPPPAGPAIDLASVDVGRLGSMTPEALDGLPFGVVTLDTNGRVIGYNDTESRLAGLPKDKVIGRNFFTEVAPCTRVREFEGRFRDFAEGRSRLALETFEFVFNFRHGAQRVVILISPARHRGRFHVSMIRR